MQYGPILRVQLYRYGTLVCRCLIRDARFNEPSEHNVHPLYAKANANPLLSHSQWRFKVFAHCTDIWQHLRRPWRVCQFCYACAAEAEHGAQYAFTCRGAPAQQIQSSIARRSSILGTMQCILRGFSLSPLKTGATPVMSDEDTGRRNWFKCGVVTDVTSTSLRLFPTGQITQAVLSGLVQEQQIEIHAAVSAKIQELLLEEKAGKNVENELDIQLTISLLPMRFQNLCLQKIHIERHHLLDAEAVDDIGYIIRDIMVQKNHNDVLFKLYQYTMPFIKHNRLNFPPKRHVSKSLLKHLMQIMTLTCLGAHNHKSKKPVLHIRRQLFVVFTQLQTQGSLADIYLFCQHHNYLVRLALMENFVHFTAKYMSVEIEFMNSLAHTVYDHAKVHRLVSYITDNFRMSALQNDTLDWQLLEEKAQIAIERCNRTCKSQPVPIMKQITSVHNCLRSNVFRDLLKMPVVDTKDLIGAMKESDMLTMALRHNLNKNVRKYPLPLRLQKAQFSAIVEHAQNVNSCTIVHRSLLHVCLRCTQKHTATSNNMRIDFQHLPMCVKCNSGEFVFTVDTLGHLIRVFRQYFYFCSICNRVHSWTSKGNELFTCQSKRIEQRRKHCIVCWRTMMLTAKSIFDKKLGVMQNFYLCSKHCPQQTQMNYVTDLTSLCRLIEHVSK